jgi:hypothetical protein
MNKESIMRTVYKVLMDKGYNPKRIKNCDGEPSLSFKIDIMPMYVIPVDGYIDITFYVTLPSSKSVSADIEKLISRHDFMHLSGIEHLDNIESAIYIISFNLFVFDLKHVQVIIDYAIGTIIACISDLMCYVLKN